MAEQEKSHQDPAQPLRELQATTTPDTDEDDALEGFINLYDAIKSGVYKRNPNDEVYYTAFIGYFGDQCSDNTEIQSILDEVESHIFRKDE